MCLVVGGGLWLGGQSALRGRYVGMIFWFGGSIFFDNKTSEVTWHVEGEETQKISYAEAGEGYERGLNREIREFVEAVLDDTLPPIPGIEGLRNTEIAQAAGISSASNRAVVLPL